MEEEAIRSHGKDGKKEKIWYAQVWITIKHIPGYQDPDDPTPSGYHLGRDVGHVYFVGMNRKDFQKHECGQEVTFCKERLTWRNLFKQRKFFLATDTRAGSFGKRYTGKIIRMRIKKGEPLFL